MRRPATRPTRRRSAPPSDSIDAPVPTAGQRRTQSKHAPDGRAFRPFVNAFWRELEYELEPHPLTRRFRVGVERALETAIWDADPRSSRTCDIEWNTVAFGGPGHRFSYTETFSPTIAELAEFQSLLSNLSNSLRTFRSALTHVDQWAHDQRIRERSASPSWRRRHRENSGEQSGDEPLERYGGGARASLESFVTSLDATVVQDMERFAPLSRMHAPGGIGRPRAFARTMLVAKVLDLLQLDGVPFDQAEQGVTARVLRAILRVYESVLTGKSPRECTPPKYVRNEFRAVFRMFPMMRHDLAQ